MSIFQDVIMSGQRVDPPLGKIAKIKSPFS